MSGSGAANAITVGSATIPAMIDAGMPPATAAAIELASSMGGQFMPPVMGIAAFLMAEFLGKDYFDVVARGWVPALIYYITVATSVYLAGDPFRTRIVIGSFEEPGLARLCQSRRLRRRRRRPGRPDGGHHLAPMFAALYIFFVVGYRRCSSSTWCRCWDRAMVVARVHRLRCGDFSMPIPEMISDLALLLATLSIMTGALVITGVPTKLGSLLVEAAGVNLAAMVRSCPSSSARFSAPACRRRRPISWSPL